ncbi:MAG: hypothetical protein ACI4KA_00150 [Oscillospiraceae bacterium]
MLMLCFKVLSVFAVLFVVIPIGFDCAEEMAMDLVYNRGRRLGLNLLMLSLCCVAVTLLILVLFGMEILQ